MRGSYRRQCDACGKQALSIAIRCPGCGRELPANQVPKSGGGPDLRRFLTPKWVAAVLGVGAVLVSARLGETSQPPKEKAEVESSMPAQVESSMARTGPSDTAVVAIATLPAESGRELRVARGWTNVRRSRSARAPVEAVLMPGDTVLADSIEQGWYRVVLEGEVLGYAHSSTLAAFGAGTGQSLVKENRPGTLIRY
jgi:hypothetical protein